MSSNEGRRRAPPVLPPDLNRTLAEVTRAHVNAVIADCHGNLARAARILGIDRSTVARQLRRWRSTGA